MQTNTKQGHPQPLVSTPKGLPGSEKTVGPQRTEEMKISSAKAIPASLEL